MSRPVASYGSAKAPVQLVASQEEARARLHYLVETGGELALLLGDSGSGKSLLLRLAAEELRAPERTIALVSGLHASGIDLLVALASAWRISVATSGSVASTWRRVQERMIELRMEGSQLIVLIDDAADSDDDFTTTLARLLALAELHEVPLTVVLATSAERTSKLGSRLLSIARLRIDLEPLTPDETASLLATTLAITFPTIGFTDQAVFRLQELACGQVRPILQIGELALVAARASDLDEVDAQLLEDVCQQLSMVQ